MRLVELAALLQPYRITGRHCGRLTQSEREIIRTSGMTPPNLDRLLDRIDALEAEGLVSKEIAEQWRRTNQADEDSRKERIWFVFTRPPLIWEMGVGDLLRHWGGEALYNSHDRHAVCGPLLQSIGQPSIIEATVAISDLNDTFNLATVMTNKFLNAAGLEERVSDFEDYVRCAIPAADIGSILVHPSSEFLTLTGCLSWERPL